MTCSVPSVPLTSSLFWLRADPLRGSECIACCLLDWFSAFLSPIIVYWGSVCIACCFVCLLLCFIYSCWFVVWAYSGFLLSHRIGFTCLLCAARMLDIVVFYLSLVWWVALLLLFFATRLQAFRLSLFVVHCPGCVPFLGCLLMRCNFRIVRIGRCAIKKHLFLHKAEGLIIVYLKIDPAKIAVGSKVCEASYKLQVWICLIGSNSEVQRK